MHTVHDGFTFLQPDGPQHFAVEQLIKQFGSREEFATLAVNTYLKRFERDQQNPFDSGDALEYACRIANRFPISKNVAERLVGRVAQAGWIGRIEKLARHACKRGLKATEVVLLVDHYVNDMSSKSSDVIERFTPLLQRYLPPRAAEAQLERIAKHDRDFSMDPF